MLLNDSPAFECITREPYVCNVITYLLPLPTKDRLRHVSEKQLSVRNWITPSLGCRYPVIYHYILCLDFTANKHQVLTEWLAAVLYHKQISIFLSLSLSEWRAFFVCNHRNLLHPARVFGTILLYPPSSFPAHDYTHLPTYLTFYSLHKYQEEWIKKRMCLMQP
jgi:hypothetical protein